MSQETNKCPRCGAARKTDDKFCPQCGVNFEAINRVKKARPEKDTARRRRWEYVVLGGVILIAAVAYNVYVAAKKNTEPINVQQQMPPQQQQQQTLQSTNVPVGNNYDEIVKSGHGFMDNGAYPAAITQYERALQLDSLKPDIMVDLGACYHAVGNNQEAARQFFRALAQNPNHTTAMYNLGVVYMTVADTTNAKKWWGKFVEAAPNTPQAEVVRKTLQSL